MPSQQCEKLPKNATKPIACWKKEVNWSRVRVPKTAENWKLDILGNHAEKRISVDFLKYLSQPWSQGLGKLILNRGILFLLTPCAVCAMLTKHIFSFSNIEIGNGVADTYTFGIYYGYDFIFLRIAHFPTEFVHGCSGSLSFALLFHSFITERVLSIFKLPVFMNFLSILSKCTHAWHGCMALFLQLWCTSMAGKCRTRGTIKCETSPPE